MIRTRHSRVADQRWMHILLLLDLFFLPHVLGFTTPSPQLPFTQRYSLAFSGKAQKCPVAVSIRMTNKEDWEEYAKKYYDDDYEDEYYYDDPVIDTAAEEVEDVVEDESKGKMKAAGVAAASTVGALLRLTRDASMTTRGALTAGFSLLGYLKYRRKRQDNDEDAQDQQPPALPPAKRGNVWVSRRLSKAQRRDNEEEEAKREQLRVKYEKRMEYGRRWAAFALQTTEELQREATVRMRDEEREKRQAKMWLENAARGSGIELSPDGTRSVGEETEYESSRQWLEDDAAARDGRVDSEAMRYSDERSETCRFEDYDGKPEESASSDELGAERQADAEYDTSDEDYSVSETDASRSTPETWQKNEEHKEPSYDKRQSDVELGESSYDDDVTRGTTRYADDVRPQEWDSGVELEEPGRESAETDTTYSADDSVSQEWETDVDLAQPSSYDGAEIDATISTDDDVSRPWVDDYAARSSTDDATTVAEEKEQERSRPWVDDYAARGSRVDQPKPVDTGDASTVTEEKGQERSRPWIDDYAARGSGVDQPGPSDTDNASPVAEEKEQERSRPWVDDYAARGSGVDQPRPSDTDDASAVTEEKEQERSRPWIDDYAARGSGVDHPGSSDTDDLSTVTEEKHERSRPWINDSTVRGSGVDQPGLSDTDDARTVEEEKEQERSRPWIVEYAVRGSGVDLEPTSYSGARSETSRIEDYTIQETLPSSDELKAECGDNTEYDTVNEDGSAPVEPQSGVELRGPALSDTETEATNVEEFGVSKEWREPSSNGASHDASSSADASVSRERQSSIEVPKPPSHNDEETEATILEDNNVSQEWERYYAEGASDGADYDTTIEDDSASQEVLVSDVEPRQEWEGSVEPVEPPIHSGAETKSTIFANNSVPRQRDAGVERIQNDNDTTMENASASLEVVDDVKPLLQELEGGVEPTGPSSHDGAETKSTIFANNSVPRQRDAGVEGRHYDAGNDTTTENGSASQEEVNAIEPGHKWAVVDAEPKGRSTSPEWYDSGAKQQYGSKHKDKWSPH